jgi:hypothetical protein
MRLEVAVHAVEGDNGTLTPLASFFCGKVKL